MSPRDRLPSSLGAILIVAFAVVGIRASLAQSSAPAVDVVQVDLDPLINAAVKDRNRFAVDIPHVIDSSQAQTGTWNVTRGVATWRYSVRVPTAVSLSFHAANIFLPASAQLKVMGGGSTYTYSAKDINKRQLWSRISRGDSLAMELTVAPKERRYVVLQIASVQAGYRGFGHAVPDHPYYVRLRQQAMAASTSSCIVNYECDVTAANTAPGQATVALIVGNAFQCSGTLINDVPHDGKPYVLTARHCENGQLGGGNPGAAANVVVYWDATSPCGSALGTLYDPGIVTQQGATTVVEQQDAWLLLLSQPPAASDAYLSGFDATGGAIQGGYTIHHALSNDKQFTAWNGQAIAQTVAANTSLPVSFTSNFWDVVNLSGTIGPGASGSALFDQNNRVVGSLSLGNEAGATADGYLQCPLSPPPSPTPQNALALFTSLAAVWNSSSDPTGSASTIQQVLDPNNTATLVVDSISGPATARLTPSQLAAGIDETITMSWSAVGASSCTASGGTAGDGWSGTLSASGSQPIKESTTGAITYGISCTYPDGHQSNDQVTVTWLTSSPVASVFAPAEVWAGGSWPVTWSTNDPPCALTIGSTTQALSGNSGTISVTQTTPGTYDYHIACGNGSPPVTADASVDVIAPSIIFYPSTTDLRLGQALEMRWFSLANSCTTGGGMPNDGWSGTQLVGGNGFLSFFPASLGTYTYTLNCVQGPISAQASVTVTVENNAPYATLSASSNVIVIGQTVTVSYKSNMAGCDLSQSAVGTQPQGVFEVSSTGGDSDGTNTYTGGNVGASQFTFNCEGANNTGPPAVSATPLTVSVQQAMTASISAPANAVTGTPFTVSWQTVGATSCSASGGGADGTSWSGSVTLPSGQKSVTPTVTGSFNYTLMCVGQIPSDTTTVRATVNVTASSPPGSSGGGSGGGGAIDGLALGILALAKILGSYRRRREQLDNLGRQQLAHDSLAGLIWVHTITGEQDIVNCLPRGFSVALEGIENIDQG
jgi:lysyl endopeptidase